MARARVYEVQAGSIVTPEGGCYDRRARRNYSDEQSSVELVDTYAEAKRIREQFYGKAIGREEEIDIRWPRFYMYVGVTNAEQYLSDKKLAHWKKELFKHVAEDRQYLYINPAITTLLNDRGQPVRIRETGRRMRAPEGGQSPTTFYARGYQIDVPMPKHIAVLAEDKGVQWVAVDGTFWECRIPNCTLAAAPNTLGGRAKVILFSYSNEGVHYMITGTRLNVTEDGIVH